MSSRPCYMTVSEVPIIGTCVVCGLTLCKMILVHIKHVIRGTEGGVGGQATENILFNL
jgi:hypothetical protein